MSSEVEHLNGWLCELGERVGVAAPINSGLRRLPSEATGPRSVPIERVRALIGVPP